MDGKHQPQQQASPAVGEEVVRTVVADGTDCSWDGAPLPDYPQGRPQISVVHYVVPPHARLEMHRHPVVNAGMVLRGALTVVADDGEERTFRAGDGVVEKVGRRHYGENRGDEPVELVMCYAGAEGMPLSEP